ncbi:MAG: hypothetical protein RLZ44_1489, partial [Pseudomonadota bacterium]
LLQAVGPDAVAQHILNKTSYLYEQIRKFPKVSLLSPGDAERRSGIVTFRPERVEPAACQQRLMAEGIICAARGGGVRLSPHFYTPQSALDAALEKVKAIV